MEYVILEAPGAGEFGISKLILVRADAYDPKLYKDTDWFSGVTEVKNLGNCEITAENPDVYWPETFEGQE